MKRTNQSSSSSKYMMIILTVVCLMLMGLSLVSNHVGGPLRAVANYTVIPLQKGLNQIGTVFSDFSDNFATLEQIKAENEQLQEEMDALIIENNNLQSEKYELEQIGRAHV